MSATASHIARFACKAMRRGAAQQHQNKSNWRQGKAHGPAVTLAACVQRISSVDKANKNWLPSQRPLRNQKTNFRLIIYSHSSTNPENLAKISRVDLTKLV